jgi:NodT family efflux transporter outer membrane factor (OMF) lipoprotein
MFGKIRRGMGIHGGRALLLSVGFLPLTGCLLHRVPDYAEPAVEVPNVFAERKTDVSEIGAPALDRWWEVFGDEELNGLVEATLHGNLDLQQAWRRLEQAGALRRISRSELFPQVDAGAGASKTETTERDVIDPDSLTPDAMGNVNPRKTKLETETDRYVVSSGLGWEIDLWRRISSATRADRLEAEATRQDVEETALFLTGSVAETWFQVLEQEQLLDLLAKQLELSETLEELTGLRFSVGSGSALDVLQQRQQVASIRAEIPPVESRLATLKHALAVLMGRPPRRNEIHPADASYPDLPPLPEVETPGALLARRPDLRAARLRVEAADYDVASAIADRLPRLSFSLDYELSADEIGDIYNREVLSVAGNVLLPLIDGGRRRAEVDRRKAVTLERLDRFGALFLEALVEVEDALVQEHYQVELLHQIDFQVELAESNLREAQARYSNGLNDYLTVITAINSLQQLQRRQISEWRALLVIRSRLYRALGGSWMDELRPPDARASIAEAVAIEQGDAH